VKNLLVTLRHLGPRVIREAGAARHPRERILNAMTLLLWDRATLGSLELLHFVQRELRTTATDFPGIIRAYRDLWARVN
jgi:hypothetical protein